MKHGGLFLLLFLVSLACAAQNGRNRKPKIVGQAPLSTLEDQSITIRFLDLYVEDRDDWFYPWGFSMKLYPGSNYTVEGNVVTPATDWNGKLTVEVTVNDGQDDSDKYKLEITVHPVNDKPVITGHATLETEQDKSITVRLEDLKVTDPDDAYPSKFSLILATGSNYTVDGNKVTPNNGFSGTLSVTTRVNDGQADSDPYALPVHVKALRRVPEITGQAFLQVEEDKPITILPGHLTVADDDTPYPSGFTIALAPGQSYTVSQLTVLPAADFFGTLSIPVTVNDGTHTSKPFQLQVSVTGVNDAPALENLEETPLHYGQGEEPVAISETVTVEEVDGDSIVFAEVRLGEGYVPGSEVLTYSADGKINGQFDQSSGVLRLEGIASAGSYSQALRAVRYDPLVPSTGKKVLYIVAGDGKLVSERKQRMILPGEASMPLDIPSGFTPNGDMTNDTWTILPLKSSEDYSRASIRVYNKSGILVYEATGFDQPWDGRMNGELLPADTYFYTINLHLSGPASFVRGAVTILR